VPAAVARLGIPAARELLLSFVDPELKALPEMPLGRIEALVWRIAEIAKIDPTIAARFRELCEKDLSPIKRELLAKVMSDIGTGEALLANLNLIDDRSPRSIPQGTWEHIEAAFVHRHRRDGSENIFTLEASASNDVRAKLFAMMLRDERRRKSAFKILGQIEEWRLEHAGRPGAAPPRVQLGRAMAAWRTSIVTSPSPWRHEGVRLCRSDEQDRSGTAGRRLLS
jgi:hypothetical protein